MEIWVDEESLASLYVGFNDNNTNLYLSIGADLTNVLPNITGLETVEESLTILFYDQHE